ncbi:unnamed protein product [Somion occarium]|uniref:Uncharacterized protein n=1 Tax=Somion occarium TaxID=3059160 RepID=A0ABP1DYI8_9APHY
MCTSIGRLWEIYFLFDDLMNARIYVHSTQLPLLASVLTPRYLMEFRWRSAVGFSSDKPVEACFSVGSSSDNSQLGPRGETHVLAVCCVCVSYLVLRLLGLYEDLTCADRFQKHSFTNSAANPPVPVFLLKELNGGVFEDYYPTPRSPGRIFHRVSDTRLTLVFISFSPTTL